MDPQIDEQVAKLLGGLKKVEAPQNFESRVMSRLSSPPATSSTFGFLKLVIPTAGLAAIALFLFLSGYMSSEVAPVDVISQSNETVDAPRAPEPAPQVPVVTENNSTQPREFQQQDVAAAQPAPPQSTTQPPSLKNKKGPTGRGSQDFGLSPDEQILPRGLDANPRPGTDPAAERQMRRPSIPASEVLRYMGASAEFRGNGWTVGSVGQNSVAERIGLKAGDVIVSFNDVRIGKDTGFPSGVDIKTIRVNRNGSAVDLKF